MTGMLVFFHCPSNSGYAISRLEQVFWEVARRITRDEKNIVFAYPGYAGDRPRALPSDFENVIAFDSTSKDPTHLRNVERCLIEQNIRIALGFDQQVRLPGYSALRRGGVATFVSYWGAPMSSIQPPWRLALKRIEVALSRGGPDHYVFESRAMQDTAVRGRGVPKSATSVTYLGVDPSLFCPDPASRYAYDVFKIPQERRIIYYSGHMEERKGVDVIVRAAVDLVVRRGRRDVHFLFLGNKDGEAERYRPIFADTIAADHITFGGYRNDVHRIIPACFVGVIASTGWDSFTMSSLEITSSGLPLLVSNLQGLIETVSDGETGEVFPTGNSGALADRIERLLLDPRRRDEMGRAARKRVMSGFTIEHQVESLREAVEGTRRKTSG